MAIFRQVLNDKQLKEYQTLSRKEQIDYVEQKVISDSVRYGYGFYGIFDGTPKQENGEWYIYLTIGNSCD